MSQDLITPAQAAAQLRPSDTTESNVDEPEIEVHHAQDSQVMGDANASSVMDLDWEASLAAEEWDDDNSITPAQRVSTELRSQPDQTEDMCTIEIQDDIGSDIQAGKRKARVLKSH